MKNIQDYVGKKFARLAVISEAATRKEMRYVRCRCDCGKEIEAALSFLRRGLVKSCGCFRADNTRAMFKTHGAATNKSPSKEYRTWTEIKTRCLNPRSASYKRYGGRGISVCQRWIDSFEAFLSDMGAAPPGTSIDRIDNNKNYEPGNCRWADVFTQAGNKRTTIKVPYKGGKIGLAEWCRINNQPYGRIAIRLRLGMPMKKALTKGILWSKPRDTRPNCHAISKPPPVT
jgi:hypothetical protein